MVRPRRKGKRQKAIAGISLDRSLTCCKSEDEDGYFYFFTFGPYMDEDRLHAHIPEAKKIGVGRLPDHRLAFGFVSESWAGGVPTPVYDTSPGEETWGVIYQIPNTYKLKLYSKEGVGRGIYVPFTAIVHLPQQPDVPPMTCTAFYIPPPFPYSPTELRPSFTLKNYLVKAARKQNLPPHYVEEVLEATEDNGYSGPVQALHHRKLKNEESGVMEDKILLPTKQKTQSLSTTDILSASTSASEGTEDSEISYANTKCCVIM